MTGSVLLVGPPGVGKSVVGPRVAEALGLPAVDLDARVESAAGCSVAALFAREGEAGFRRREREALARALAEGPAVIATGGGAWLDRAGRRAILRAHRVVGLTAPREVLLGRLQGGPERPLLVGAPGGWQEVGAALDGLLEARSGAYAEVHATVEAREGAAEVAGAVVRRLRGMGETRVVPLGARSYRVGVGALGGLAARMAEEGMSSGAGRTPCVVTDRGVYRAQGAAVDAVARSLGAEVLVLPAGEATKRLGMLPRVWGPLLAAGADRGAVLVAVGGGVVSDLVGLAAALYLRGIRYVTAPTTLLAMADASVGGKTAVDLPQGKNLVGAFHQPSLVHIDPALLDTLGAHEYASGLAEVVKVALAADPGLFASLEASAGPLGCRPRRRGWSAGASVRREALLGAVQAKIDVVARDEREGGPRAVLNLGHTLGHCIEHASGYRLRHGLAVSVGMVGALELGVRLGVTPAELRDRVLGLLRALGLPTRASAPREDARRALGLDKKRVGKALRFVLMAGLGEAVLREVPADEALGALDAVLENG